MAIKTLRLACVADAWLRESNLGAGKSHELPIGLSGGNVHRALLRFAPIDWAGEHVSRVISAEIVDRNTGAIQVARGASPRVNTWRILENWSEGSSVGLSTGNTVRWDNMPARTAAEAGDSGTLPMTSGLFCHLPCTLIVRKWAPASVSGGGGAPNYGILLKSFDEATTSRTTEIYSREAGTTGDLILSVVVETNLAPDVPINLAPSGDGAIGAIVGGSIAFTGERVDPDVGDYVTGTEIAVHADSATDGAPGSAIVSAIAAVTTQLPTFSALLPAAALTIGTHYRWRGRTRDKGGLWSPWTSFLDGRFIPDYLPGAPINLSVDVASLDPDFFGTLEARYTGQVLGAVRIVVYQDSPLGTILKWDSDFQTTSGSRFDVNYGGTPLVVGERYRWAAAVRDAFGAEGPMSSFQSWTVADITGPTAMSPINVETKQGSLTPNLTIGHSSAFDAYELEVAKYADGSSNLWDVGVTAVASTSSTVVVYAGIALTWGRTYYWRAKVRVGGTTWTDWSPWYPFYVNALPDAPVGSVDASVDSETGHVTVVTTTATLRFPFSDPDVGKGYTEAPTRREIEIVKVSDLSAFGASPYVITSGITDTMVTGTLVAETLYQARARYDDNSGQRSPWSAWVVFKRSSAPTVAAVGSIDVADPNPLVDWSFTGSAGKTQARFEVRIFDNVTGQLVHDSGVVVSAATAYVVPGEILANATAYRYQVVAYDTDLLSGTVNSSAWTTSFGTPDALTGLLATADTGASAVVLTWDATTLDPNYFWRYYIYRLNDATGGFERIGAVADVAVLTYTDFEAPHGDSTYAVTVSNGWVESAPVTVSVSLALRWWIADPNDASLRFEIRWMSQVPTTRRAYQQETFEPLGRTNPVVVSGQLLSASGQLVVTIVEDDAAIYDLLERAVAVDPYVVLKTPFGETRRVKFGSIDVSDDREDHGLRVVTIGYQTVA